MSLGMIELCTETKINILWQTVFQVDIRLEPVIESIEFENR